MMRKTLILIIAVVAIVTLSISATAVYMASTQRNALVVATTTSLYDTGLLEAMKAIYDQEHKTSLYFISVGTGQAIDFAKRGDADIILVHSPSKELQFLQEGHGVCRKIVAYNFFTLVGPENDPAQIRDSAPLEALQKIAEYGNMTEQTTWVSRGDGSGTHDKEKSLWAAAGFIWQDLGEESWYMESGTGMGKTLQIAEEFSAYTLADMGTYLKYYKDGLIHLEVLVSQGKDLLNVYSAIAVNQTVHGEVNFQGAIEFIKYLVSDEGQQFIGDFGKDKYGESLFSPAVQLLKEDPDSTIAQWIKEYAFFDGSECPPQYRDGHDELYQ